MTENNDSNVTQLVDIFSTMDISIIKRALFDNNNNLDRTIEQLIEQPATIDKHQAIRSDADSGKHRQMAQRLVDERSNSAVPTAQTANNFNDKVYAGIIGNMHDSIFINYAHDPTAIRTKMFNKLKNVIERNQLTIDFCDKFIDEMVNLQSGEMKEIGMLIVYKIQSSQGNEQKNRCEQALIFVDRLTICNDSIWIYYYELMLTYCYGNLSFHVNNDEKKKIWPSCKEKYIRLINLQFWKEKNYSDRIWIIYEFSDLCCLYTPVSKETIDLVIKWINELKVIKRGTMSEKEWNKSKMWIEKSEIEIEMRKLQIDWKTKNIRNEKNKYCSAQMNKLKHTIEYGVQLTMKEIRLLNEAIRIQLNPFLSDKTDDEKKEYCIDMLNQLDRIRMNKEAHWIRYYRLMIDDCYKTLGRIVTDLNERQVIANRMQMKYRQLIDISDEIFSNELNHPFRIVIMLSFASLCHDTFSKIEVSTDSIQYLQLIIATAKSLPKGSLTDFEFEDSQGLFYSNENLLRTTLI